MKLPTVGKFGWLVLKATGLFLAIAPSPPIPMSQSNCLDLVGQPLRSPDVMPV